MNRFLVVASSPHIRANLSTQKIMALVIASLIPAGLAGAYFLGSRSLLVVASSVAACVAAEGLWQKCARQPLTVRDLSAALTGLLLAYNLPPAIPLWMPVIGGFFAIIVVKQFFGGLGQNVVNPALAGRAMMLICWPVDMTNWTVQGVSGPTALALAKGAESFSAVVSNAAEAGQAFPELFDAFIGRMGGCIGETSSAALIAGGVFLIASGIISWRIPVIYIVTAAAASMAFGSALNPLYEVMSGGLLIGAFFMATDYTTSPITPKGQAVFAAGCGILTSLIRAFGGYPEGVSYSILIMNFVVPIIDGATKPKILGEARAR
ncbi:MAG: RnfABCDGE type electron transport complex subunit D [Synergistaceae bacterium]|jgi:electron transport complex protein RnfD|nr:RnfABCDGE type electron transport complex subunit D [Synergistaceae bacterium]